MSIKDFISLPELQDLSVKEAFFVVEYGKDFNPGLAAERCGMDPAMGAKYINRVGVKQAIARTLQRRMAVSDITAEWLLYEMVDNHTLARQAGNFSASNKALEMIGKMAMVDAFAADKVELRVGEELAARLQRGRDRAHGRNSVTIEGEIVEPESEPEDQATPELTFM